MSDRKIGPIAKELIAAKARIADPENWCQTELFQDGRMCALGAAGVVIDGHDYVSTPLVPVLASAARSLFPEKYFSRCRSDMDAIWGLNDELGHAAVMQMYDHAIQRALSEGK